MVPILLRNLAPGASTTASMVVAVPKPQLVKLVIGSEGEDAFVTGRVRRKATRYMVKVEIGGIKGALAPLAGSSRPIPTSRFWAALLRPS